MKFTVEHENDNSISFLDLKITRHNNSFSTSVFRKSTFSGQGISFFSYCCTKFKINAINTLLHRAYNLCSSNMSLHSEIKFLQNFFENNGFPRNLFRSQVEKFFAKKLDFQEPVSSVARKQMFFSMQYFGHKSILFKIELSNLISEYFCHIEPNLVLTNNFRIGSFFNFKDSLPKTMRSSVIYKYCCPHNCGSVYVGSTCRTLRIRAAEHRGFSPRTGQPLQNPSHSSIRLHSEQCSGDVSLQDFDIIDSHRNSSDLRILESLYILKLRPNLNEMSSAFNLRIATM